MVWAIFAECAYYFASLQTDNICTWDLADRFKTTVSPILNIVMPHRLTLLQSFNVLRLHQKFMFQASLSLSIFFNAMTYFEVYISIMHPFWYSDKRMIWYKLLSVAVILIWYVSYMFMVPTDEYIASLN